MMSDYIMEHFMKGNSPKKQHMTNDLLILNVYFWPLFFGPAKWADTLKTNHNDNI